VQVQVLSPAPKKSYHFDTTFFIQTADLVYHHGKEMNKKTASVLLAVFDFIVF
jgi:hypothetical protein